MSACWGFESGYISMWQYVHNVKIRPVGLENIGRLQSCAVCDFYIKVTLYVSSIECEYLFNMVISQGVGLKRLGKFGVLIMKEFKVQVPEKQIIGFWCDLLYYCKCGT